MNIDLDTINQALAPKALTLTLGGVGYTVRDLPVAETLLLDTLGTLDDQDIERQVQFVGSLFASAAPPVLGDLCQCAMDLTELRNVAWRAVGEKPLRQMRERAIEEAKAAGNFNPSLQPRPDTPPTAAETLLLLKAKLPDSLANFVATEHRYFTLSRQVLLIIAAIKQHMLETVAPGKSVMTAMQMISRQIQAQQPDPDSPD